MTSLDFPPIPGARSAVTAPSASASRTVRTRGPIGPPRQFAAGFLPDGTELVFTITARSLYRQACSADGAESAGAPASLADALTLLFFCAHEPTVWNTPRLTDHGTLPPLRADAFALLAAIDDWALRTFRVSEEDLIIDLARGVWDHAHENLVVPLTQKKTAVIPSVPIPDSSPLSTTSSATSSPTETPPASNSSATAPPSATSTPPSTAGIPPAPPPFAPPVTETPQTENLQNLSTAN